MSSSDGRRERLLAAQRRLAQTVVDPTTNPNMIPQLTGQLVAIERRLDRPAGRHRIEDSLPVAQEVSLVDLLAFEHRLRGQIPARRSQPTNEYLDGRNPVFESWKRAGFELSKRSGSVRRSGSREQGSSRRVRSGRDLPVNDLARQLLALRTELPGAAGLLTRGAQALAKAARDEQESACPQCGGQVAQLGRGRPRTYCSSRCRRKAWRG